MSKVNNLEEFKTLAHSKVSDYCSEVIGEDIQTYLHEWIDGKDNDNNSVFAEFVEWLTFNYIE